jgi:hypothetical protein
MPKTGLGGKTLYRASGDVNTPLAADSGRVTSSANVVGREDMSEAFKDSRPQNQLTLIGVTRLI